MKGTPSMGKRNKKNHVRCRRWGTIPLIQINAIALNADSGGQRK